MNMFYVFLGLALFVSGAASAKTKSKSAIETKVTEGKFLAVEQGDYMHLQMQDSKGKEFFFWCLDKACRRIESVEEQKKLTGKMVRVHWRKVKKFLESAGEEVELELANYWHGQRLYADSLRFKVATSFSKRSSLPASSPCI